MRRRKEISVDAQRLQSSRSYDLCVQDGVRERDRINFVRAAAPTQWPVQRASDSPTIKVRGLLRHTSFTKLYCPQ